MGWLVFSLLNAFFESVSNAFNKRGALKIDLLSAVWSQRFFALFIIIPLVFITDSFQVVNQTFWTALLATSFLNTVTSLLFVKAIKDSPLSLTLPIVSLTPVFLLITSPIMLGEFPTPLGTVGILTTVVGSYILNVSKAAEGIFEPFISLIREEGTRLMLLVAFIWSIPSETDIMPIFEEFSEEKTGNAMIVDSKTLPDKAHDFRVVRSVIRVIEDNFGMDPEDKEQDKS